MSRNERSYARDVTTKRGEAINTPQRVVYTCAAVYESPGEG